MADQAEDIVQVALIRVVEILKAREGNAGLASSYLWKAAYTATVDEIRRLRRRREVPLEDAPADLSDPLRGDPERTREAGEIGRGLSECLARLIESRRLAVTLHLQGHSVPEAARLLGWSAKRVENLVFRGMADLRRCLAGKGLRP
jgi:RNA polymerase sigma-70 factor (ECF subfamily)